MLHKINKFIKLPFSRKAQFISSNYYRLKTRIFYRFVFKKIAKNVIIKKPLFLTPEFITVGNNVFVWNDARIEGVSSYAHEKFHPHIILEDGVSIQQRCHITAADSLRIGKNTLISFNVSIQDTDHKYEDLTLPIGNQPLIVQKTEIGENCFLGSDVKIQAGTILGKHCVVGANAVVRGIFPDYCVIVGVPARVVKRYNPQTKKWQKTDKKGEFLDEI